jgi:hypothetical protein
MAKALAGCFRPEAVRGMHETVVESAQRVSIAILNAFPLILDGEVVLNGT